MRESFNEYAGQSGAPQPPIPLLDDAAVVSYADRGLITRAAPPIVPIESIGFPSPILAALAQMSLVRNAVKLRPEAVRVLQRPEGDTARKEGETLVASTLCEQIDGETTIGKLVARHARFDKSVSPEVKALAIGILRHAPLFWFSPSQVGSESAYLADSAAFPSVISLHATPPNAPSVTMFSNVTLNQIYSVDPDLGVDHFALCMLSDVVKHIQQLRAQNRGPEKGASALSAFEASGVDTLERSKCDVAVLFLAQTRLSAGKDTTTSLQDSTGMIEGFLRTLERSAILDSLSKLLPTISKYKKVELVPILSICTNRTASSFFRRRMGLPFPVIDRSFWVDSITKASTHNRQRKDKKITPEHIHNATIEERASKKDATKKYATGFLMAGGAAVLLSREELRENWCAPVRLAAHMLRLPAYGGEVQDPDQVVNLLRRASSNSLHLMSALRSDALTESEKRRVSVLKAKASFSDILKEFEVKLSPQFERFAVYFAVLGVTFDNFLQIPDSDLPAFFENAHQQADMPYGAGMLLPKWRAEYLRNHNHKSTSTPEIDE